MVKVNASGEQQKDTIYHSTIDNITSKEDESRRRSSKELEKMSMSLWFPDVNDDESRAYLLTESLNNFKFSQIWHFLHHTMNWKYQASSDYCYRSPPSDEDLEWFANDSGKLMYTKKQAERRKGRRQTWHTDCLYFKSSREIQDCLEGVQPYRIPPVLHIDSTRRDGKFEGQGIKQTQQDLCINRLKRVREDVLRLLYIDMKRMKNKDELENVNSETEEYCSNSNSVELDCAKTSQNEKRMRKRTRDRDVTVTSTEKGAERYFSRRTTKSKSSEINLKKKKAHRLHGTNLIATKQFGLITSIENHKNDDIKIKESVSQTQLPPWPSPEASVIAIRDLPLMYEEHINLNFATCKICFPKWRFILGTNHSLLFYGFGSKKKILEDLATEELRKEGDVIMLNGYDKEMTISELLDIFVGTFLGGRDPLFEHEQQMKTNFGNSLSCAIWNPIYSKSFEYMEASSLSSTNSPRSIQRAMEISKKLSSRSRPIFLVIHNVDLVLRNHIAQECLAVLTSYSKKPNSPSFSRVYVDEPRVIRLVASTDHVNIPSVLWDLKADAKFAWVSQYCIE